MFGAPLKKQSPTPAMQQAHVPAPMGGLNTLNGGTSMPPTDCVQLYNMIAAEYGLRVRQGYREWTTGLTGASDNYVRSVLPFTGSADNGANDKLFVTTSSGIWDVTSSAQLPSPWAAATAYVVGNHVLNGAHIYICDTSGTSAGAGGPTGTGADIVDGTARWDWVSTPRVLDFASTSGRAGHGVCHVQVTAGGHFLFYWDEENGLHIYADAAASGGPTAGTWMAVSNTDITGVDPANLVFGTVFKGRVFHVEADTANLWYTDAGAIYGAASRLNLGFKLKAGGPLVGCWSWTYDGGSGIDDALVVASRGGDVCVYKGTDPSSVNSFGLDGVWGVGALPAGRELATDFGGDLLLLTRSGIVAMSKLVLGKTLESEQYETAKIANLFTQAMLTRATVKGWTMRLHPEEGALMVTVPEAEGAATTQLAMALNTRSWSRLRDLPIYSSAVYGGKLYFGTVNGKLCINDGYRDGVTLADPTAWTAVQYAGLSSFQSLGNATNKQVHILRGIFLGESTTPSFSLAARYDFDFTELATVNPVITGGASSWDSGVWDTAIWGGDYTPSLGFHTASGIGSTVAIAWRGAAGGRTILVGFDVGFTQGGFP